MANGQVIKTTEEIFGKPVIKTTEELFGKKLKDIATTPEKKRPPFISTRYWLDVAKKLPSKAMELATGLQQLPGEMLSQISELGEPEVGKEEWWKIPGMRELERVGRQATERVAWPMAKGMVMSFVDMVKDPVGFLYERPDEFVINALVVAGGVVGASSRLAKLRSMVKAGKTIGGTELKTVLQEVVDTGKVKEAEELIKSIPEGIEINVAKKTIRSKGKIVKKAPEKPVSPIAETMPISEITPEQMVKQAAGKEFTTEELAILKKKKIPIEKKKLDDFGIDEPIKATGKIKTTVPKIKEGRVKKEIVDKVPSEISASEIIKTSIEQETKYPSPKIEPIKLHAGINVREMLDNMGIVDQKAWAKLDEAWHSPDVVFSKHPAGTQIYELTDMASLNKGKFLYDEGKKLEIASKGIKKGSNILTGVAKIKESGLEINDILKATSEQKKLGITYLELNAIRKAPEVSKRWLNFLRENYDYLLRKWGTSEVGLDKEGLFWRTTIKKKEPSAKWLNSLSEREKEVFDVYNRRVRSGKYLTHIFEPKEFFEYLSSELGKARRRKALSLEGTKRYKYWSNYEKELIDKMAKVEKSRSIFADMIPSRVNFRFFMKRTGAKGYELDSMKAYKTYLSGIARKIFDEPAVREAASLYNTTLPSELKNYTRWYLRNYMGYDKGTLSNLSGSIKSLMWLKTLGFNPRSAIVNLTQKINTIADAGPKASVEGWVFGHSTPGRKVFDTSGLAKTTPTVLMEGAAPPANALEALRKLAGFMFSKAEEGNLRHAFSTGYLKAIKKGIGEEQAVRAGIKLAEKTQFRYGTVGTPKMLRGWGGVAFQFWSYPIKQIEFLSKLAQESHGLKLLGWWGMAEGTNKAMQEFLNTDLSNALGFGINYGELISTLREIPSGDVTKIMYHLKQSDVPLVGGSTGGGIFPYGFGPFVESIQRVMDVVGDQSPDFQQLVSEIEPVQSVRVRQAIKSLTLPKTEEGKYPIYHPYRPEKIYEETPAELAQRTLLTKPMTETREQKELRKKRLQRDMYNQIQKQISELFAQGEVGKALNLAMKYSIPISKASIKAAIERQKTIRSERIKKSKARAGFERYLER